MGSYTSLDIGEIELALARNLLGDYGWLFKKSEKTKEKYFYIDNDDHPIVEERNAFSTQLENLRLKLELAGYSPLHSKFVFLDRQYEPLPVKVSQRIVSLLKNVEISKVRMNLDHTQPSSFTPRYDFGLDELNYLLSKHRIDDPISHIGEYSALRLFIENPKNHQEKVIWRYADVVDGGWISEEEIEQQVEQILPRYLIITEGSSDSFIIEKAIQILYPEVKSFFTFIDMTENYPFTGTGNLYKFCQGLSKLRLENRTLVIYDNDTEGVNKFNATLNLNLSENIAVMRLPNLPEDVHFETIGPNGESHENVNNRAVSIEMFLDLRYKTNQEPRVRWLSYDRVSQSYQRAVEYKEKYVRIFGGIKTKRAKFDFSKLDGLLKAIFEMCQTIS